MVKISLFETIIKQLKIIYKKKYAYLAALIALVGASFIY